MTNSVYTGSTQCFPSLSLLGCRESSSGYIRKCPALPEKMIVGLPRIELGLHPPHGRVLPVYYSPTIIFSPTWIYTTTIRHPDFVFVPGMDAYYRYCTDRCTREVVYQNFRFSTLPTSEVWRHKHTAGIVGEIVHCRIMVGYPFHQFALRVQNRAS